MKSNILRFVTIVLAAVAASSFSIKADELSDLLAAIANFQDSTETYTDIDRIITYLYPDSVNIGEQNPQKRIIDVAILDGVYNAMRLQRKHEMLSEGSIFPYEYGQPWVGQFTTFEFERRSFYRPVPGKITSYVGWRPQFNRMHHGVDMSLCIGDTVRAAVSGTVEKISYDHDGYGHYVVMEHHDGMETIYGHIQYALVCEGEFVYAGQPLAIGGNSGNSTGPHLHFEVRLDNVPIDPTLIFDFFGTDRLITYDAPKQSGGQEPVYSHQSKSLKRVSTYIVRYGDTLQSIARQAGISVMRLCQLNMLQESSPLEIGRMLKIR